MQFFIILSSCENWVTQISKIEIETSNWIFLSFAACSHYNFLQFVLSYIHVIYTCLFMCDMSI